MAFTRTQAKDLLNQAEMTLYDDSRINRLRRLTAKALEQRIERTRKARDRARDLLQRQKLASRARTGDKRGADGTANQRSKRKAELLADILKRFEARLKPARKREKETAKAGKQVAPAKKAGVAKASVKTASTGRTAQKKPAKTATKAAAKTPAAKPGQGVRGSSRTAKTAGASKSISPRRALSNTRKLLEAKHRRERQGQPWQTLDPGHDHLPQGGYQSGQAAEKAEELHAGESRVQPIQGSISTRDRKHQARRDRRG